MLSEFIVLLEFCEKFTIVSLLFDCSYEDIRELGNTAQKYSREYSNLYGGQQIHQISFWTHSKLVSPYACHKSSKQLICHCAVTCEI